MGLLSAATPRCVRREAGVAKRALLVLVFLSGFCLTPLPASAAGTGFVERFAVLQNGNQQGLAYGGGSLWACFDTGDGLSRIVRYSLNGRVLKRSPELPLGHCAEIAYRKADGTIYAVDYTKGGSTAHVRVVDMSRRVPAVVKTMNVATYGLGQMVAIDNARDQLLLKGGSAPYRFNFFALSGVKGDTTMRWLRQVTFRPPLGTPQGLEVVGNRFLFLSSYAGGGSTAYNRIHVFSLRGTYKRFLHVRLARESEGLALAPGRRLLYLGFHKPKAVYQMNVPSQWRLSGPPVARPGRH